MHNIEKSLVHLLESSVEISISALGGIEELVANFNVVVRSKLADEFLDILIRDESISLPQGYELPNWFNETLKENSDPLVAKNVALLVSSSSSRLVGCFDTIMDQLNTVSDQFIKGQLLLSGFAIAVVDKPKQYRFISFLVEKADYTGQADFIKYFTKISGLAYSYFANDDLLNLIEDLHKSMPESEDANFELGLAYLKVGLNAQNARDVKESFEVACSYFIKAETLGNLAAACFKNAIEILLEFSSSYTQSTLGTATAKLKTDILAYSAYHLYSENIQWASLRQQELMQWFLLCEKLEHLNSRLGDVGWLNPVLIIEEFLLKIYDAQRSVLMHTKRGGVDMVLQPEIIKRIVPLTEKISLLEQWIASVKDNLAVPVAKQLIAEIENYKAHSLWGNGKGTVSENLEDIVPAIKQVSQDNKNAFYDFVQDRLSQQSISKDKIVVKVFNQIMNAFIHNGLKDDNDIWIAFQEIIYSSLMFLKQRMDATVKNNPRSKYLFAGGDVLEAALQDDYYQYMHPQIFNCSVDIEQDDIAGGRADVFFRFADFFIVSEVKREKRALTVVELYKEYVAQTKEYQNTSAKLGVLFVLDLSIKKNGIGSFESNVKEFIVATDDNGQKRGIVLFRMPGNRITPSKMKSK